MTALLSELMDCPDAETLADLAMTPGDLERRGAIADHASQCESCHAALLAVLGAAPAAKLDRIARYIVVKRIGAGGMGVVYKARDPELQRDVAIKMLYRGAPAERLRREAQALARLTHPNVVAVHDVGEHAGHTFIAMALVDGETLRRWLAVERSGTEIVRVLCAAARGIEAAHAAGLVHRDLKPDNVFVSRDGDVLVGDFGLARDREDGFEVIGAPASTGGDLTLTGTILGTPAYMAPEQAAGAATALSDQFSYCVTAYEALYGTRPFTGANLDELVAATRRGVLAAPLRDPGTAPAIERALRRGLAADPADRFPDMATLRAAIEPRPRRWPLLAGGIATVTAASVITWVATREPAAPDPETICAPTRTAFAETWNPERRASWVAALRTAGKRDDAAAELAVRLDRYATSWTTVRHDACLGAATGLLADDRAAQQLACLETRRATFDAVVASTSPEDILTAWRRVSTLPEPATCRDATHAFTAGHQALMLAFAKATTPEELAAIAARAERDADQPAQLAIALAIAARALADNRLADADTRLRRAVTLAESLEAPAERVRALALSGRSFCLQGRNDEADRFLEIAEAAGKRLRDDAVLDAVLDARAACLGHRREYTAAIPLLVDLLARVQRRFSRDSFEAYDLHHRLATAYQTLGRTADAAREVAEWNRLFVKLVGNDQAAIEIQVTTALQRGDIDTAIEHQRRIVANQTASGSHELASSHLDLASFYEVTTEWSAAIASYDEAIRLLPDRPDEERLKVRTEALVARGESQLRLDNHAAAAPDFERAVTDAATLKRADLVLRARLGLARVAAEQGDHARAVRLLREVLPAFATAPELSRASLGGGQFALARAAWATGDRAAARAAAHDAEATISRARDDAQKHPLGVRSAAYLRTRLATIERWRDAHR